MTKIRMFFVFAIALGILGIAFQAQTQDQQMTPEQKAMYDAWLKNATPGEHHTHLAALAGVWKTSSKGWWDPNSAPMESTGSCEYKTALGGRFLSQSCTGIMMGTPFEGWGVLGYDNTTKKHTAVWMDNMGTTMILATGTCDKSGGMSMAGEYADPMTGKNKKFRYTITVPDKNKHVMEWYEAGPDGKEMKSMEITYTR